MTIPEERYHAINMTRDFLLSLLDRSKTPRVPKEIRERARRCLRHFPGPHYVSKLAEIAPDVLLEGK